MWDLPMDSHRYFVEQLGGQHAYSMLSVRFVKFLQNVQKSDKVAVQFRLRKVQNNVNTVTGKL